MRLIDRIKLFTLSTILLLASSSALATVQAGLITGTALGLGSNNYTKALPGASIQACINTGVSTLSCTSPVATYSDPALSQPISPVADVNGNYSFYVSIATSQNFVVQITATGYNPVYQATIAGSVTDTNDVTQIVAGTNVSISPAGGTGVVTVNAAGGGTSVSVNGINVSSPNFNGATPSPTSGYANVQFQSGGSNVSAQVPPTTISGTQCTPGSSCSPPAVPALANGMVVVGDANSTDYGSRLLYNGSYINGWSQKLMNDFSTGPAVFKGVAGALMGDCPNLQMYPNLFQMPQTLAPLVVDGLGTTDSWYGGYAGNANQQTAFQSYQVACEAYAALATTTLYTGAVSATETGSWAADTTYAAVPGRTTSSAGATRQITITTNGGPIYFAYYVWNGDTGVYTVSIDGSTATDTITGGSTLSNGPYGGATLNTPNGSTRTVAGARYVVGAGTHTLLVTCTTVGTHGCGWSWAGTPPPVTQFEYTSPAVLAMGIPPQINNSNPWAETNATLVVAYNTLKQTIANQLAADGLAVKFVPVYKTVPGVSVADMSGAGTVTAGGLSFNDATMSLGGYMLTSSSQAVCTSANVLAAANSGTPYVINCNSGGPAGSSSQEFTANVVSCGSTAQFQMDDLATSAITAGTVCRLGFLGQVIPGSTGVGLHLSEIAHLHYRDAIIATLKPSTVTTRGYYQGVGKTVYPRNFSDIGMFQINSNGFGLSSTALNRGLSLYSPIQNQQQAMAIVPESDGTNYAIDMIAGGAGGYNGGVRVCTNGSYTNIVRSNLSCHTTITPSGTTAPAYFTATNCAVNSASPAACGSAAAGAVVVPTTTTTYTVNTTAVTAHSRIFLMPMSFASDLPSSPTCVAPAVTSAVTISAITAATSFTFALPSTSGQTCWSYRIEN